MPHAADAGQRIYHAARTALHCFLPCFLTYYLPPGLTTGFRAVRLPATISHHLPPSCQHSLPCHDYSFLVVEWSALYVVRLT